MRKSLLLATILIYSSGAFSQIGKGNWLAGGNASFSYDKVDYSFVNNTYETSTWQLSPSTGYFFLNKVAAGLRVNFRATNNRVDQGIKSDQQLSLSPFMRYYFLPKEEKVNLFIDAAFLYGRTKFRFLESPTSGARSYTLRDKTDGYSVAAGPVIFLNKKTALELTISFTRDGNQVLSKYGSTTTVMGGVGFQVHLGK